MSLDWQYRFNAKDERGNHYIVMSEGNTWTWSAWIFSPEERAKSLGRFGSGEDAKRACEDAAIQ